MTEWLEVALRSLGGFVVLFLLSKVFVRKPLGESSLFEFSILGAMAIVVAFGAIQLTIPIVLPITAIVVFGILIFGTSLLSQKNKTFRSFFYGDGVPIIKDGKILEDNMKKQRITTDDLLSRLRSKDVFQYADVEFAVLEGSGELNILTKQEQQPITPQIMKQKVPPIKEPETVIMDGRILHEPLATRGLSHDWLISELKKRDAAVDNVFVAQVDEYGQLSFDLYDDVMQVAAPTELPLLEASLKKVQADLELFALDTENEEAKQKYQWCAEQMNQIYQTVTPYTKE
ncbi:DUF421 domain-containing protein [Salipaludibacillus daqingensis]|uniref:DUF421 domain-containing protein n=1 Tax=Salipaludibacillus daqingensis TaxID=3041001 RepID=UPI0024732667|nr:DUF421 domain-containing protein [Salipaludibacillus daqingensis]